MLTAPGLPVEVWRRRLERVDRIALRVSGPVLVVAAHPDDETLGVAGIMARIAMSGGQVYVVVATDGEAAYGDAMPELAALRRAEVAAAMSALCVIEPPTLLGLPDGDLAAHEQVLVDALTAVGTGARAVFAPWRHDPHPDHRAAGRAAAGYAAARSCPLWEYPIWMRHWTEPSDPAVDVSRLRVVELTEREQAAKRRAIGCHRSQIEELSGGRGAVLPPYVLAHFADAVEAVFIAEPAA